MAKKKTTNKSGVKPKTANPRLMAERRADLGASADPFFARIKPESLRAVAARLRAIVRESAPNTRESIKWGMPFYELNGMLGYIKARPKYITLGFYHQGIFLADPSKRLEGTGKNMRHVKVYDAAGVDDQMFRTWVRQAAAINAKG